MVTKPYLLLLAILSLIIFATAWDHRKGGDDWNFKYCNQVSDDQQSPIVVDSASTRAFTPPYYLFPRLKTPATLTYIDLGWTFRLVNSIGYIYTIEPFTIVHGLTFKCKYVEFHAPAEHVIDGRHYPLEMQIYADFDSGAAVPKCTEAAFSFFFNTTHGKDNPFFSQFLGRITKNETVMDISFDYLLPPDVVTKYSIFSYRGSKTSPNCEPNVNWYLMDPPLDISPAQLKVFNDRWLNNPSFGGRGNNRFTKPRNATVFRYP